MPAEDRVYVIAEAGVNHNGDMALARDLIDVAAAAGADAVKFQTFTADRLVSKTAPKAAYQKNTTAPDESQYAMLKRLELSPAAHFALRDRAAEKGIDFLSTPFDIESLRFLTEDLNLATVKVPSGEVTNGPFLVAIGRAARNIILSTGMSDLDEVRDALAALAWGTTHEDAPASRGDLVDAFSAAPDSLNGRVTILHCTTEYPAPVADTNLRAMDTLAEAFGLPVGLSDHSDGILVPVAAAARSARVIEKHLTLDRSMPGPDHAASLEPGTFTEMVDAIRLVERALGDGEKTPRPSEIGNIDVARRSLTALCDIEAGATLTQDNIGAMRPGGGASPMAFWRLLGTKAAKALRTGDKVDAE